MREGGGVGAVGHTTRLQYYDPFCLLLEGLEPTGNVGTLSSTTHSFSAGGLGSYESEQNQARHPIIPIQCG